MTGKNDSDRILSSIDLSGIAKYILDGAKNIIVMTGAGISVSAGIPDFRTAGTGLYSKLESYHLPNPESIFTLDFFRENPQPFYTLAKEIYPGLHCPTPTHYFLKLLADKGVLLRVFTQNIDSLERMAGLDPLKVVAAHGNFDTATCIDTGEKVDTAEVKRSILLGKKGWGDMNDKYGGLVKPDIVFFGEKMPERFFQCANEDFSKCDLLIVMGTSLKVQPFASLIDHVDKNIPRLLINRDEVGVYSSEPSIFPYFSQIKDGFDFSKKKDCRDVALLIECDIGVRELVDELGWRDELEILISTGNERYRQSMLSSD